MSYITGWIVVGIITLGIYKLFELFVGKKERLTMIEKLGDKLDPSMLGNRLSLPLPVGTPFMSSFPISFSALKFGCLLLGIPSDKPQSFKTCLSYAMTLLSVSQNPCLLLGHLRQIISVCVEMRIVGFFSSCSMILLMWYVNSLLYPLPWKNATHIP